MLTGSCLCRKVQFQISGDLGSISYCHCVSCRKAQGTAFVTNAPVPSGSVVLTAGETLISDDITDGLPQFGTGSPDSLIRRS